MHRAKPEPEPQANALAVAKLTPGGEDRSGAVRRTADADFTAYPSALVRHAKVVGVDAVEQCHPAMTAKLVIDGRIDIWTPALASEHDAQASATTGRADLAIIIVEPKGADVGIEVRAADREAIAMRAIDTGRVATAAIADERTAAKVDLVMVVLKQAYAVDPDFAAKLAIGTDVPALEPDVGGTIGLVIFVAAGDAEAATAKPQVDPEPR